MKIIKTKIEDLLILKSQIFKDKRGALRETYRKNVLNYNFPFDIVEPAAQATDPEPHRFNCSGQAIRAEHQ